MLCWDDLRHFLAVARTGSTLAAGRSLAVSQTTVARRIAALEAAIGVGLFERRQAGYALTPEGEALLSEAEAVEQAAAGFEAAASGQARQASGSVRLSTAEIYAATLLPPLLVELRALHPAIRVELDTSDFVRDLAAGEADIVLRGGSPPAPGALVGRRIGHDPWTVYCSRDYADLHGIPHSREELATHPFIGGGG